MEYGCNTTGLHLIGESEQESLIWNFWWAVHFMLRCAWPPRWSDISPPDNILWRVCKPQISEQLKTYIRDITAGIVEELQCNVTKNLTDRVQGRKAAEGVHLLHSSSHTHNPNVHLIYIYTHTQQQQRWFIFSWINYWILTVTGKFNVHETFTQVTSYAPNR